MSIYDPVFRAQEDLQIINEAIDRMNERSRVSMTICAGILYAERRKLIVSDPIYQEAAWRLAAGELKSDPDIELV
jgi:hypothetical protein